MVSLWPWKAEGTSAAEFEKTLSSLATKIAKVNTKNDKLRQRARRAKFVWTIYSGFAYILASLILTLVTGYKNWGPVEYTAIAGGPLLLYAVRAALTAYYNYRISSTQAHLDSLYKERDATISKLKAATKYDTTQQLLDKYGSPRPQQVEQSPSSGGKRKARGGQTGKPQGRTNLPPPPTANIPRNQGHPPPPLSPQRPASALQGPVRSDSLLTNLTGPPHPSGLQDVTPTAEFAPNAYSTPPQYAPAPPSGTSRWMDRLMNVLMGEDETQPINRLALICSHCRLVNGQAPPGTRSLEDVEPWRCGGCGGWNGHESEAKKIVKSMAGQAPGPMDKEGGSMRAQASSEDVLHIDDSGPAATKADSSDSDGI